jgi:hypothetical protein
MHKVTLAEFSAADFGDIRREKRFVSIINNISSQPGSSIPRQNETWYDTKATYEFFKNDEVSLEALRKTLMGYGARQVEKEMSLLVIHDISNIAFNNLDAEGLGYLDNKHGSGLLCYTTIASTPEGLPLSLLYQHTWTRPPEKLGKAAKRGERKFEDKESYRWYEGMQETNKLLGQSIHKIHIADRQADIYELFFNRYETKTDLLIRASVNRKESNGSPVWNLVAEQPAAATVTLDIPDRSGKKKLPVSAQIRFHPVTILRPIRSENEYESVNLTAIEIKEEPTSGRKEEDMIHWKLLTSIEVKSVAEVLQCAKWYSYRWLIERFHYVLKSGTRIETLQLKQAESLQKAVMVYSIAAFRIMQLVYNSRHHPHVSCEVILTKSQWKALYVLIHREKQSPVEPPSLQQAVMWIGRLGGHLGRKSDGPPGLKTVWLGYQRLCDATMIHELTMQNLGNE